VLTIVASESMFGHPPLTSRCSAVAWGIAIAGTYAWYNYSSKRSNDAVYSDVERDAFNAKRKIEVASKKSNPELK
jgi:hypothetical protein